MGLKQTAHGRKIAADAFIGRTGGPSMSVGLFTDDHVPDGSEDESTYHEPVWTGYAQISVSWPADSVDDGTHAQAQASPTVFTCGSAPGSPVNHYGYFVWDTAHAKLLYSERFADAPRVVTDIGDTVPVVLRYRHSDE